MSLPTPHVQALSTYRTNRQASSPLRNSSSPFSLAIPPRNPNRHSKPRTETLTPPISLVRPDDTSSVYTDHNEPAGFPRRPKKAVLINEKPIFPASPYKHVTQSSLSVGSQYDEVNPDEPKKKAPLLKRKCNDHVLAFGVTIAIAIILAIAIPLGVILPQKVITPLPINILLPFYIDPVDGAWQRLYDTVVKHHDTNFTVILNPHTVPGGNSSFPPTTYMEAVKALNVYPNICTLGYIDTQHGQSDNATVRAEIAYYAKWANISAELALHGVYFDHTPWQDDNNGTNAAYLRNLTATAKHAGNWADGAEGFVVLNPGRMPEANMTAIGADITVMFDGVYDALPSGREAVHGMMGDGAGGRQGYAMMVQGVPRGLGRGGLRKIVEMVRRDVEWLYVTDVVEGAGSGYASFWKEWMEVIF